jgi:hypothetical protein
VGLFQERGHSHRSISHLDVSSKWVISSSDRVYIMQQIRGGSDGEESIGKDVLMGAKSASHPMQGTREDALSCVGRVGEGQRGGRWAWCGRSRSGDQGCCSLASLTPCQPIKLRRTLRSFAIQKMLFRK